MKIFETKESIAVFSDRKDGDLNFYTLNQEIENNWSGLTQKISIENNKRT